MAATASAAIQAALNTVRNSLPLTWVVGAGGLLGRQIAGQWRDARGPLFSGPRIPWSDPGTAQRVLRASAREVAARAGEAGWQVIWCAGAGVMSTSADVLGDELAAMRAVLSGLEPGGGQGAVFLASSVGGIYAGNPSPPFTEESAPMPLSPYGEAKLAAEGIVAGWAQATGTPALIGRISNLYGPGQNLAKPQGLISQICANYVRRRPTPIWVSLDTIRDYLYVTDCAGMVLDAMARLRRQGGIVVKILASGQPITIAAVLGEVRRVLGRRPEVLLGGSPNSRFQVRDLSVASVRWPQIDQRETTPLVVGIHNTITDLRGSMQREGV